MKKNYLSKLLALVVFFWATSLTLTFGQTLEVTAPASVAGTYTALGSPFNGVDGTFSGEIVEITDVDGLTTACVAIDNGVTDVTGKIALIDRGACGFSNKVLEAEAAGAIAAIICNNNPADPDFVRYTIATCDAEVNIPSAFMSYADCQTIRVESGIMATFTGETLENPNEFFNTASEITEGTYSVNMLTGNGSLYNGISEAAFFSYTATADGLLNINSCDGGSDTFLSLWTCGIGLVGQFDDDCDEGNGEGFASEAEVLVTTGTQVIFSWDAISGTDGFDFSVTLNPLPAVDVDFTVNMAGETVSPDGVNMVWAFSDAADVSDVSVVALTDNGDNTWSGTVALTALDTLGYAFMNGALDPANIEAVPDACGLLNPFGFNIRPLIVNSATAISLEQVCFGTCEALCRVPTDVSFTVNMANETVGPDGVNMVWAFSDAASVDDVNVVALTDNGDDTWSGTVTLTTLDTLGYAFMNGALDPANIEAVPDDCGLLNPFGFNIRPLIVTSEGTLDIPSVCFSTCLGDCPDLGCASTPVVSENLDGYVTGELVGPQSDAWTVWDGGAEGGPEDAPVSDEQAFSLPNSVKIEGNGGPDDVLLNLGDRSEGVWDLRFKLYVEPGFAAYYNIQDNVNSTPNQWNLDVSFEPDGTLGEDVTGTYTPGAWIDVIHVIDLDNESAELIIEGKSVYTWTYGPDWKIGSFDFFPRSGTDHLYYIDDVVLRPLDPCPAGAIICDGFEVYSEGPVSDQSANWAPWTSSPADDGLVQADPSFVRTGCQSLVISDDDPDDQLLLLGDRTEGNYLLEWYMYVPAGSAGYYNFQKFQNNPGSEFHSQVEFFTDGTATLDAGAEDVVTWNWTADQWMHIKYFIDLDNDWTVFLIDDIEIYSFPWSWSTFNETGTKQLGSIDFFGNTDVLQYIDDVLLQQLPSLPGNLCAGANDIQNLFGQGVDVPVTSDLYNNNDYTSTGQDPTTGYECFGEPDSGGSAPSLERTIWYTFVGDGNEYYITTVECNATDYIDFGDTQIAIYSGDGCGALTPVACGEDIDLANGVYEAEVTLQTEAGVTYYMFVDGFGPDFPADGEYCLEVTQKTLNAVTVTFQVDASILVADGTLNPEGIFLSGSFNGWPNPGTPMTEGANNIWTVEVALDPDQAYEYKFQNGTDGWEEGIPEDCTVGGVGSNREIMVGNMDQTVDLVCFDYCVTCDLVMAVDGQALQAGVKVFPNPASELLNVRVDLPEAADNLTVRMLNTFGQVVSEGYYGTLQTGNIEINVSNIPAGVYQIQVMDGTAQYTQSVIVE